MKPTPSTIRDFNSPEVDDTAYVGRHRNLLLTARVVSSCRDEWARERRDGGRPESYQGSHRTHPCGGCGRCGCPCGTGCW